MVRSILIGAVIAALSLGTWFAPTARAQDTVSVRPDHAERRATAALLSKPITIELVESRLEDVIQFLTDYSGATFEPVWNDESGVAGLDKDQPITVSVKNVSVLDFLERVLLKARTDNSPATWQFATSGGTVEIGPRAALNKKGYLKLYDIQDMLFEIPNFNDAPELDLDQVLNQGGQGGGGGGGSVFGDTDSGGADSRSAEEIARDIIDIIVANIEPEQWQDNGGDGATIRFFNGNLLVRAPDYIHRQLGGYPFDFRAPARTNVPPAATTTTGELPPAASN